MFVFVLLDVKIVKQIWKGFAAANLDQIVQAVFSPVVTMT